MGVATCPDMEGVSFQLFPYSNFQRVENDLQLSGMEHPFPNFGRVSAVVFDGIWRKKIIPSLDIFFADENDPSTIVARCILVSLKNTVRIVPGGKSSYLRLGRMLSALKMLGADSNHPRLHIQALDGARSIIIPIVEYKTSLSTVYVVLH